MQLLQTSEDRHMDYSPFPTREHMLLYLMVNGTKPVVGSMACNAFTEISMIILIFYPENAGRRYFKIFMVCNEDFEAFNPFPVINQAI